MPTIIKCRLDTTGLSPDNLITNELKTNIDPFSRMVIPVYGDFYTESLVVRDGVDVLVRGTDYACIEFNQKYSLSTGKEVFSTIVLLRDIPEVTIDYQALGGEDSVDSTDVTSAYQLLSTTNPTITWENIHNKPLKFKSTHHQHDIDEVYGFEYLVKEIMRIKNAIEIGPIPSFNTLLAHMDKVLEEYSVDQSVYMTENMAKYLSDFSDSLNTSYFDIENLQNFTIAYERDGATAGTRIYTPANLTVDKYLTVEALVGMKNVLYASFISKRKTGISLEEAQYGLPVLKTLVQMVNGSTFNFISQNKAREDEIATDDDLYFNDVDDESEVAITKLNNNTSNRGGIYLGYNPDKLNFHVGNLLSTTANDRMTWKRILSSREVSKILDVIDRHCSDFNNPHNDEIYLDAVGLEKVEDLPVVSREDILGIKSVHKYLTFDSLLYFMRAFLLQNGKSFTPKEATKNQFIIDNCVVVYTPAGIICKPQCGVTEPLTTPEPTIPPMVIRKIAQACGIGSKSFILDSGYFQETITDKSLIGQYDYGTANYVFQNMQHFSRCCGYDEDLIDLYVNNPFEYLSLAQLEVSNVKTDQYYTITVDYLYGDDTVRTIRVSGVYDNYQNRYYFKTTDLRAGDSMGGQIKVSYSNRYYAYKTGELETFEIEPNPYFVNDPSLSNEYSTTLAYLYVDRAFIKQGTVANVEMYIDRGRNLVIGLEGTQTIQLSWNPPQVASLPGVPSSLFFDYDEQFKKIEFELPYMPELDNVLFYFQIEQDDNVDFPVQSNTTKVTPVPSTKITRTVPLYVNNVQTGSLVISRENQTGYITIENITIPTSESTSDPYFLRGTDTTNFAPVIGVIDVWNTYDTFDWEYPLPSDDQAVTPEPTPTYTTPNTTSPNTTQPNTTMPTTTQATTTQAPTTTPVPTTTGPGGVTFPPTTTATPTNPPSTVTNPPTTTQSQFIIRALGDKQDSFGDDQDVGGDFGPPVYSNKYWNSEQEFVDFLVSNYPESRTVANDQSWPGTPAGLKYIGFQTGFQQHFKQFPRSSIPNTPPTDPSGGTIGISLAEQAPLFQSDFSWMVKDMILDLTSLTPGETYIIEYWVQNSPSGAFSKNTEATNSYHVTRTVTYGPTNRNGGYARGFKKHIVAGISSIKHSFRIEIANRDTTPFSYYCKVYNVNTPGVVNTSNTVTMAFVPTPVVEPPLLAETRAVTYTDGNVIGATGEARVLLNVRNQQNVRYTVDYFVRAVYGTAIDTGYVKRLDVSLVFDLKNRTNENDPRGGIGYTPTYSPGYGYEAYKLPETYWSDPIDQGNGGITQFQISTYIEAVLEFTPNGAITDAQGLTVYVYAEVYPQNDPSKKVSTIGNPAVFTYINN